MASDEPFEQLRSRMREFIEVEVYPREDLLDEGTPASADCLENLKREAKQRGLWALGHPADIGGGGRTFMESALLNEVIGRSYYGQNAVGTWSMQDSLMLREFANAAQRERWLAPLVAAEIRSSVGLTEPDVPGSDPTAIASTAIRDGDDWVINAHKWFTTGADIAAFTTIFAVTEPDGAAHSRVSAILVPTDVHGYEVVRHVSTLGTTHTLTGDHCEIRLTDVRVPYENLLGDRGQGFRIAQRRLGPGRIFHAMRWLGQMERALELMIARAKERHVRGAALIENGQIQAMIAESAMDIFYHRAAVIAAADAMDRGSSARLEISLVKVRGAQLLHQTIDRALQVHGAMGVTTDTPLEGMYRRARYARIYDGPDETHRDSVSRLLQRSDVRLPWS